MHSHYYIALKLKEYNRLKTILNGKEQEGALMNKKRGLTKFLAVGGTVLIWIPIVFTVTLSIIGSAVSHRFLCDYLMPAELFPVAFVGALALLWAAMRVRILHKTLGLLTLAMVIFLAGGQLIAVLTGLASGAVKPGGWQMALALAGIVLYTLAVISLGITGINLIKKLKGVQ